MTTAYYGGLVKFLRVQQSEKLEITFVELKLFGTFSTSSRHSFKAKNNSGPPSFGIIYLLGYTYMAKTPLQSRFTLLKSKFFPAKFPFSKIQKKNLAGKIYFEKE
jgi:hypothetical protein